MSKSTDLWEILVTLTGKEISLGEAHDQISALPTEPTPTGDVEKSEQLCDYCKKPLENTCCHDCLEEMEGHNH